MFSFIAHSERASTLGMTAMCPEFGGPAPSLTNAQAFTFSRPKDQIYKIEKDKMLGEGSYSSVFEAKDASGHVRAAKLTDLTVESHRSCYHNEVGAFRKLGSAGHPNIVRYHDDYYLNRQCGVLIMEKLTCGSLEEYLKRNGRMNRVLALELFAQLCSAVERLHQLKISHRDLKAENVAFDPKTREAKLFDMGFAITVEPNRNGSIPLIENHTGSPLFMAPEVLDCKPHDSYAADVWCLGQILYHMLVGKVPFHFCKTLTQLRHEVLVKRNIAIPTSLDNNITALLKGMLDYDPKRRFKVDQIKKFVEQMIALENDFENRNFDNFSM